jgi:hypothetical protein
METIAVVVVVVVAAELEEQAEMPDIRVTINPMVRQLPIKRAALLFNVIDPPQ